MDNVDPMLWQELECGGKGVHEDCHEAIYLCHVYVRDDNGKALCPPCMARRYRVVNSIPEFNACFDTPLQDRRRLAREIALATYGETDDTAIYRKLLHIAVTFLPGTVITCDTQAKILKRHKTQLVNVIHAARADIAAEIAFANWDALVAQVEDRETAGEE